MNVEESTVKFRPGLAGLNCKPAALKELELESSVDPPESKIAVVDGVGFPEDQLLARPGSDVAPVQVVVWDQTADGRR
jgi:hypothetical protein